MCGRYSLAIPGEELQEVFGTPAPDFDWRPRWNVAPGQECPVVTADGRGRRLGLLRWGFLPAGREPGPPRVNARSESVARRRPFREAFGRRRCLVPADGFYEWTAAPGGGRQPWWFRPAGGGLLALGGVWQDGRFAILTTEADEVVRPVHDRMPLVVQPADWPLWLDPGADRARAARLLDPPPGPPLRTHPVSTRVNRVEHDDADLVVPVDPEPPPLDLFSRA